MATDKRISDLPSVTSPSSTDVLPIVSAGITSQVTVGNLHSTLATTGSNTFHGNQTIDGNLSITGTTTLGGNIIPASPRGASLGTLANPFGDIFVSSGSINIAGIVGQPNTTLSNVSGNILISAGGMQLVGSGAFNAATGSFQFISGSMTQIGDYSQTGNYTMVGNKTITGSLNVSSSIALTGSLKLDATSNIQYTPRLVSGYAGTVLIDYSKDSIIHIHTTGSTVNISGSNLTPGRVVDVIVHNDIGGTSQINHGISSTNSSNGSSFYLATKQLAILRYYCLDGTTANTFVTAIIS